MSECPRIAAVRDHQVLAPDVISNCIKEHINNPDPKKRFIRLMECQGCPDWPFGPDKKNNHSKWPEG